MPTRQRRRVCDREHWHGARHAAAATWREEVAAGVPLSGAQLGERYGRSPGWGRAVIADGRAATEAVPAPTAAPERHEGRTEAVEAASLAVRRITTLAVLAVALVAAVASYDHQRVLAELAGKGWRAWLLPLPVDGLVVAASTTMLVRRRRSLGPARWPRAALLLGVGASLAANVAAADPTVAGRLVAASPPVALLLAYELLMQIIRAGTPSAPQRSPAEQRDGHAPDGR